jgi:hypothetical protein
MKTLFVILIVSFSVFSQTATLPTNDFQFWSDVQLNFPLKKIKDKQGREIDKLSLFINGTFRIGKKLEKTTDERFGIGLEIKVNKFLSLAPSYLYRTNTIGTRLREYESRFRLGASLEKKWKNFYLRDKNLLEYRLRNSKSDSVRYRNKLQFFYPLLKNKKELFTPYLADEVYYDFHLQKWTRNEIIAGLTKKLSKNLVGEFFYVFQRNRGNILKNVHALGINFKIRID